MRHAILMGNSAEYENPQFSVKTSGLKRKFMEITDVLASGLGKYSFVVNQIVNETRQAAQNHLSRYIENYSKLKSDDEDSCLLFYYFGHAVVRDKELCFIFSDSDNQVPKMLKFREVMELIFDHNLPAAIFVLDCCYAGGWEYSIPRLNSGKTKYFVLSSTSAGDRAFIEESPFPFGKFSNYLFKGLRDDNATNSPTKIITPRSWFRYAADHIGDNGEQTPQKLDGGLGDFEITQVSSNVIIRPEYNNDAPKTSFYAKIRWICGTISNENPKSIDRLYGIIKKRGPIEMLTPYKTEKGTIKGPITEVRLQYYIYRLKELMILEDSDNLNLTTDGKRLVNKNNRYFSEVLSDLAVREMDRHGFSQDDIDTMIRYRLVAKSIPNASGLYDDIVQGKHIRITLEWFTVLLDLLCHCKFFRYSQRKTYFPQT